MSPKLTPLSQLISRLFCWTLVALLIPAFFPNPSYALETPAPLQWAQKFGGLAFDFPTAIATDPSGNSYVTGYFAGAATLGNGGSSVTFTSIGSNDGFVAKYNPSGVLQWAQPFGGTTDDRGSGISIDASGNAYVNGNFTGTATFGTGGSAVILTSAGSYDGFVAKYNATGVLL